MTIGPTQKTPGITNMDATPIVANTAGNGAPAHNKTVDGYVTPAAADAAGTKYIMCRVPSHAVIKAITLASEAQGAGAVDCGVYYPDDARYTPVGNLANVGLVVSGQSQLFASDVSLAAKIQPTSIIFESGNYTFDKWSQPLWQAAGLTTDPGGHLDILLVVHTTDITTGTGKLYLSVSYVTP